MPNCEIEGCTKEADRVLSIDKTSAALTEAKLKALTKKNTRKYHICKDHYRAIKKYLKKDRKIERARWQT